MEYEPFIENTSPVHDVSDQPLNPEDPGFDEQQLRGTGVAHDSPAAVQWLAQGRVVVVTSNYLGGPPQLRVRKVPFPALTDRERAVALLLALGEKNAEIAAALGISIKTVDTHRGHILKKLKCRNNVDLARLAIREGYVQP